MKAIKALKRGSSAPIVIEHQGKFLLVKLRAGMSGEHALLIEYFGTKLGSQIGLPTLTPSFITLNENLDTANLDIEIKDLLSKSQGLNIAFDYKEGTHDLTEEETSKIDSNLSSELFLFDLVMLNIDRTTSNTNLIGDENSLYSIDYESSLMIQELFSDVTFSNHTRILQQLRNNPLYQEVEPSTLLDGLSLKKDQRWNLNEILDKLNQLNPQSAAELKTRNSENQSRFKKNFEGRL